MDEDAANEPNGTADGKRSKQFAAIVLVRLNASMIKQRKQKLKEYEWTLLQAGAPNFSLKVLASFASSA